MAGKLYIVPTPVGNLADMTPRAIEVLKTVDTVLAEDTRTSGVLLKHFDIATPMRSHHKFNEHEAVAAVVEQLQGGAVMALISDAGTPGISDPGFLLSRECRRQGVEVETLPGPTAFVPALVNSGLPCDRFVFEGFLPQKKGRATRLEELKEQPLTMIFYESPAAVCRDFRHRPRGQCGARNQQDAQHHPQRHAGRTGGVFHRQRAAGRDCRCRGWLSARSSGQG